MSLSLQVFAASPRELDVQEISSEDFQGILSKCAFLLTGLRPVRRSVSFPVLTFIILSMFLLPFLSVGIASAASDTSNRGHYSIDIKEDLSASNSGRYAENEHFSSHADSHNEEGHETGGLPQLDVSSYPSQIFWLVICFLCLYFVFSRNILPSISTTIQNRSLHIQDNHETAARVAKEAEEAQQSYEDKLQSARLEASQNFKQAEAELEALSDKRWQEFRNRAAAEEEKQAGLIQKAKEEALEEMNMIAAELAREAAEKIVGVNMDMDTAKDAVRALARKGKAA